MIDRRIGITRILISKPGETAAQRARTAREADGWYDAFTQDIFG